MTTELKIALAQVSLRVGGLAYNLEIIRTAYNQAAELGADLVLFPELAICGYPPEDLILKKSFLDACLQSLETLAADTAQGGPALLIGAPWQAERDQGNHNPELDNPKIGLVAGALYNAALLLDAGKIVTWRAKAILPNHGVFDEKRLFTPGALPGPMIIRGVKFGVLVCEDMWEPDGAECLMESGAEILVVINGSPFETGKRDQRLQLAVQRVSETGLPLIYVNQVGGQDELVFDGGSFVLNADHQVRAQLVEMQPDLALTRWELNHHGWNCAAGPIIAPLPQIALDYQALMLGLGDYVTKNGFPGIVLGLSGGIDSALSAAIAVDALGAERVRCVMMPSSYTSVESLEDATEIARFLGVILDTIPIDPAVEIFTRLLANIFPSIAKDDSEFSEKIVADRLAQDITDQNLQSRSRGVLLMALSNRLGLMVLSTGNKSEMSVGYATLYGDMCGGYSVLKDVYKTKVLAMARWRNTNQPNSGLGPAGPVMPERVIVKPPSAELKPDQRDEDSLPPYDRLDKLLQGLIEEDLGLAELTARGHDAAEVARIWGLLEGAEYKRHQAPPGVKITTRTLSQDRRYPITNSYRKEYL